MEWFRLVSVLLLLGLGMFYSGRAGKLTTAAAATGGVLGLLIYLGSGFVGLALLALFFVLGTAASGWRVADKRRLGLAEENQGRRRPGQVLEYRYPYRSDYGSSRTGPRRRSVHGQPATRSGWPPDPSPAQIS